MSFNFISLSKKTQPRKTSVNVVYIGYDSYWDKKELIPAEVKDIDGGESLELVQAQLPYIVKYVEVFKDNA